MLQELLHLWSLLPNLLSADRLWVKGANRTLEGPDDDHERWIQERGGNRNRLKSYYNVEFLHLLPKDPQVTGPTTVLKVVVVALLHSLLLNPTNHILNHLGEQWDELEP